MWGRGRLSRRDRGALDDHLRLAKTTNMELMEGMADKTDAELDLEAVKRIGGGPTQEDVDRWFRHSVGSWKRGYRAAG